MYNYLWFTGIYWRTTCAETVCFHKPSQFYIISQAVSVVRALDPSYTCIKQHDQYLPYLLLVCFWPVPFRKETHRCFSSSYSFCAMNVDSWLAFKCRGGGIWFMLAVEKPAQCQDHIRAALRDRVKKTQIMQWTKLQQKQNAAVSEAFLTIGWWPWTQQGHWN